MSRPYCKKLLLSKAVFTLVARKSLTIKIFLLDSI
nr:MAG TPA: hypothetical protein [Caudoviricetes sp.]